MPSIGLTYNKKFFQMVLIAGTPNDRLRILNHHLR